MNDSLCGLHKHTKAIVCNRSLLRPHKSEGLSSRHKGGPVVARTLNVQLEWEYNVSQTHHQMVAFLNPGVCDQLLLYFLISPSLCVRVCACMHAYLYTLVGCMLATVCIWRSEGNLGHWSFAFSLLKTRSLWFTTGYAKLTCLWTSRDSHFRSRSKDSKLPVGAVSSFPWVLGTQTQVLKSMWQAFALQNHLLHFMDTYLFSPLSHSWASWLASLHRRWLS